MTKSGGGWRGVLGRDKRDAEDAAEQGLEVEGRLWQAHEQARETSARLLEQTAQLSADLAKHQGTVDALREQSRMAQARALEFGASLARLTESFERLRLLALNVGLEGARLGEPAGRILGSVAEEVRVQAEAGVASVADLRVFIDEVVPVWSGAVAAVERLRQTEGDLRSRVDRAHGLARSVADAIGVAEGWRWRCAGLRRRWTGAWPTRSSTPCSSSRATLWLTASSTPRCAFRWASPSKAPWCSRPRRGAPS